MVALAACGDTTTSPRETARNLTPTTPAPSFDFSGGGSRSFGDQSSDFTVTSRGGSFSVNGLFNVNFPENSVCNPARSTYGNTEWDKACSILRGSESIKVTAKLRLMSTGVAVDFSPELRFSPSTEVTISTDIFAPVITSNSAYFLKNPNALSFLAISFSPKLGGASVADYVTDPSLITQVYLKSGLVRRRIKHFSGYLIAGGQPCEPGPGNPDCIEVITDGP
jgi:hypothetical protein